MDVEDRQDAVDLTDENELFLEAINARDDGDDDIYIDRLTKCIAINETNRDYHLKLILAYRKIGKIAEAKLAAQIAAATLNDDPFFLLEHARISDGICDWDKSISERYFIIDKYIEQDRPFAAQAVIELVFPLCEANKHSTARGLITHYKDLIFENWTSPRAVFDALLILNLHGMLIEYLESLIRHDPSDVIDGLNVKNSLYMAKEAQKNLELLSLNDHSINILSLGQNCLPYSITSRWGLNSTAGIENEFTIFDLGAFSLNYSIDLINSDFAMLRDRTNYWIDLGSGGVPMARIKDTAISFFHERGIYWIDASLDRFHTHIAHKIDAFKNKFRTQGNILLFCICGDIDFGRLVFDLINLCDSRKSKAIILNVTKTAFVFEPQNDSITYIHAPYPDDYNWNWIGDYTSDRGIHYENNIVSSIFSVIREQGVNLFHQGKDRMLSTKIIESSRVVFGRLDGSIIAENLKLNKNGTITPALPNETYWKIREGILHFLNERHETTTVFDRLVRNEEVIEYHGKFIVESNDSYHHRIEFFQEKYIFPFPPHRVKPEKKSSAQFSVLLRTHVVDEKFYDLYNKLNSEDRVYDLFPLVDTTRHENHVEIEETIYHKSSDASALLINDQRENLLWWYGDYAFYFAFDQIPNYDYYIMLEYDIEFIEHPVKFLNELIEKIKMANSLDLVGIDLRIHYSGWAGWNISRKYFAESWSLYYPFVVLSKRALSFLLAQRQKECFSKVDQNDSLHCEPFTAGNLMMSGFNCFDLNEVIPGSYDLAALKISGGLYMGSPLIKEYQNLKFIHPVYSAPK